MYVLSQSCGICVAEMMLLEMMVILMMGLRRQVSLQRLSGCSAMTTHEGCIRSFSVSYIRFSWETNSSFLIQTEWERIGVFTYVPFAGGLVGHFLKALQTIFYR